MNDVKKLLLNLDKQNSKQISSGLSTVLSTVKNTLLATGISGVDICSPANATKKIAKMYTDWEENAVNSFKSMYSQIGGNALATIGILVGQITGGLIGTVNDVVVNEVLYGNMVTSFMSVITTFLSVLPACEILMQYRLVLKLKAYLQKRVELLHNLNSEILVLTSMLKTFKISISQQKLVIEQYSKIKSAVVELKKAERILSIEISKLSGLTSFKYSNYPNSIIKVEKYMDSAIDYLTAYSYSDQKKIIYKVLEKYNFPFDFQTMLKTGAWEELMKQLTAYFVSILSIKPGNLAENSVYRLKTTHEVANMTDLVAELLPIIPSTILMSILQNVFNDRLQFVSKSIPVVLSSANQVFNTDINKWMEKAFTISGDVNKVNEFLGLKPSSLGMEIAEENENFDSSITVTNLTSLIKLNESNILLFPTMWKSVKAVGSVYANTMKTVKNSINDVITDMNTIISDQASDTSIMVRKIDWVNKIISAKGLLTSVASPTNVSETETQALLNTINEAGEYLEDLKSFIIDKSIDPITCETKPDIASTAVDLCQQVITLISTNSLIFVSPKYLNEAVGILNAIRILFTKQMNLDDAEILLINNYLSVIEKNPNVMDASSKLDSFVKNLELTPAAEIAQEISNGDLTTVVNTIQSVNTANELIKMVDCSSEKTGTSAMDFISNVLAVNPLSEDSKKYILEAQAFATRCINSLQNGLYQINYVSNIIQQGLEKLMELQSSTTNVLISNTYYSTNKINDAKSLVTQEDIDNLLKQGL